MKNLDSNKIKNIMMIASGMAVSAMLGYAACMIKEMMTYKNIKCIIEDM